jgi:hypothetical protein
MPADKKRKSFNDKGRLVGNDLARMKRMVQQYAGGGVSRVTQYDGTMTGSSLDITVPEVNRTKTYILLTTKSFISSSTGDVLMVTARFTTDTNVRLERDSSSGDIGYVVQTVEHS